MADYDDILRRALADPTLNSMQRADIQRRVRLKQKATPAATGGIPVDFVAPPALPGFQPGRVNVKTDYGNVSYIPNTAPTVEDENKAAAARLAQFLSPYQIAIPTGKSTPDPNSSNDIPIAGTRPYELADLFAGEYIPDPNDPNMGVQRFSGVPGVVEGAEVRMSPADRREAIGLAELSRGNLPPEESAAIAADYTSRYMPMAEEFFQERIPSGMPVTPTFRQPRFDGVNIAPAAREPMPVTKEVFADFYLRNGKDINKARQELENAGYYLPQ